MKRIPAGLEIVAAVSLGAAVTAAFAGPLRFDVLGAALSVRTLSRPLLIAAVVLAARAWLLRGADFLSASLIAGARVLLGTLIAAGVIVWLTFLSTTCGGADSYGYVSAAGRILNGTLIQVEPLAALLPFPEAITAACPLGYTPGGRALDSSVPIYPLGLPGLMAAAMLVFGPSGPFGVAPLMGLVLLWAAYATSRAWYGDSETALLACALTALNPIVVTYSIQPMSDVPAGAMLMIAVAALSAARSPAIAGASAGIALLIRPALAPIALLLAVIPLAQSGWSARRQATRYLIPISAAIGLQAGLQWYLYGDPRSSGYGSAANLFSLNTAAINARSYGYWGLRALGLVWLGSAAVGLSLGGLQPRLVAALVLFGVGLPYLFYRPFDHWETLRFLLPVVVVLTIVAASGLMAMARWLGGRPAGLMIAAVVAIVMASGWVSWLSQHQVFSMPVHEARHKLAGDLVAQVAPANAVILALQHSGSLRYYAQRQTMNWEHIPSGHLNATVEALQARGFAVYLMIDSAEEQALFEARHGSALTDGRWLPGGQRRSVQLYERKK